MSMTEQREQTTPLLVADNIKKHYKQSAKLFGLGRSVVKAVDGVSFELMPGETLSLVGESGCGKSTTGRAVLYLERPTEGQVRYNGQDLSTLSGEQLRKLRKDMQIVFQDPYSALNGRMKVRDILTEPFRIHQLHPGQEEQQARQLLEMVGLSPASLEKYPHEFSGGQRQRIVIARAIALRPQFIVCDEPVSALDVSVQSQIVNLFGQLQKELDLTYLFISHDLSVVRHVSDRVGVMYLGKMVELGHKAAVFDQPLHPYTQALMSAIPIPNPKIQRQREKITLRGELPSPLNPPTGCRFHTRCPWAVEQCRQIEPEWREARPDHWVACHLVDA
ncbi:dipeptide ABC transporter ATP-binding protein [Paenibacillus woosongensis]|uniref:Dipeptide ABC transporter ATP-binding protein n=1 Tax=Paenibacillus woosongensis TaxID=307580 RepID=A0AA95IBM2_9BACL|nr:dipeptide ABC transporter ATP-binding protein [Paenibacillus woosongensis]WHX50192.1 dipeptide ABC transporter ATP-binding protein [Paenibacillus woosongensis]